MNSVIWQSKGTVSGSRQMTDIRAGVFFLWLSAKLFTFFFWRHLFLKLFVRCTEVAPASCWLSNWLTHGEHLGSQFSFWMCRLWITWNPSLLSVIGEQNWLRNAWLRHRKRSVLKCLQRYHPLVKPLFWKAVQEHWCSAVPWHHW